MTLVDRGRATMDTYIEAKSVSSRERSHRRWLQHLILNRTMARLRRMSYPVGRRTRPGCRSGMSF